MERHQARTDAASGFVNEANEINDWSAEHGKPRCIFELLPSVVTVSLKTNELVASLPRLTFEEGVRAQAEKA